MASAWRQTKLVIPINLSLASRGFFSDIQSLEKTGRATRVSAGKVDGCADQTSGKQQE